jgi:hypothetical protein
MKIKKIEKTDIPTLIEFNHRMYPKRDKIQESVIFQFFMSPLANKYSENLIAVNEKDEIIGQILMMPNKFRYREDEGVAFWAVDFIVIPEQRGSLAGILLPKQAVKLKHHFGVGVADTALAIHKRFGEEVVGYFSKFIKLTGLFSFLKFLFPPENKSLFFTFPDEVTVKDSRFIRVQDAREIISDKGFWNNQVLEFARDIEFLQWRYFHLQNKYFIYKLVLISGKKVLDSPTSYFVVRPIIWKKVPCLLLVDYRVSHHEYFTLILKAVTRLARNIRLPAVITGCSLPSLIKIMARNYFFKFSGKSVIVTNYKNFIRDNSHDNDNILVTFGDSDCDFYFGNSKW